MTNQAGGDAGSSWHRQLFVGQIPGDWNRSKLEKHLAHFLKIPEDHIPNEIQFDHVATLEKPHSNQKKIAFIRFKSESYHSNALKKETFMESEVKLNIKESNQENEKRKLFFGRLCDDITKEKVIDMIEIVCPGYGEHVEEDFPQVPEQNQGKSRIAFVLFKTHQAARDVKEAFKKLIEQNNGPEKNKSIESLKKLSHSGTDIRDLVAAVDYHKRNGKLDEEGDSRAIGQYARKNLPENGNQQANSLSTETYNDGSWKIHVQSYMNDNRIDACIMVNPADLQHGRYRFGNGKRSSIELSFLQPVNPGIFVLPGPPQSVSPTHVPHQLGRNLYPNNSYTGMYSGARPNYSVRRNYSSTNNTSRNANHNTLGATRSESGLHR